MRFAFVSFFLVLATPTAAQQLHPTPENLEIPVATTVSRSDTISGDPSLDRLARQLRSLRVVTRVGGETEAGEADFGLIMDVALDPRGRMVIMDRSDNTISRWTSEGRPAGRFGRNGGGPLESYHPQGLTIADDGTIIAADRALGLKRFRWDSTPVFQDVWLAGETVDDLCVGGATTVVQRFDEDGTVVQLLDAKGTRIRGIGSAYRSPDAGTTRMLSDQGHVACLPGGVIASSAMLLPFIRLWNADGSPRLTVQLAHFIPMTVTTTDDGAVTYSRPSFGYEVIRRLVPVGREHLLVQVAYHSPESSRERAEFAALRSYLIRVRDGRSVYLGTTLPIVGAAPLPKVYGWRNDPVPEAVILQ